VAGPKVMGLTDNKSYVFAVLPDGNGGFTPCPTLKHIESLLVGATGAAKLLGVGKSLFYEMASTGRLGPLPILLTSKKKVWSRKELERWCDHRCPPRDQWLQILKEQNGNGEKKY